MASLNESSVGNDIEVETPSNANTDELNETPSTANNTDACCTSEKPPLPKRARTSTSDVWKSFTKLGIVDGKEKAKCNSCGKEYIIGSNKYGTLTLLRHIPKCVALPWYHDVGVMMLDQQGRLRARRYDHKCHRDCMAKSIIEHDLPYSYVEYRWVRETHENLNPEVKHISRNTAVSDVWNFYLEQKEKLKHSMMNSPARICLTSNCWTAYTVEGYICLIAHFVDDTWKLNSKILSFCKMVPPSTVQELARKILACLKEWGIDKKIFSLTLDNASANDSMQNILKEHLSLQNSLLCDGRFFHVRCCAHIWNLIVNEGLKVTNEALQKIRESIKYVRASEARKIMFNDCVEQVGGIDTSVGLRLDVPTRWNSTFMMLDSALKYRRAFGSLALHDKNFVTCPLQEEWRRGELIRDFLNPFYVITNLFSGSSYPTSNVYFMQIWKIECLLRDSINSDDLIIHDMASRMMGKFDKYWSEYSVILSIACVFDPRCKFDFLQYYYERLDVLDVNEKINHIKNEMYDLFSHYEKKEYSDGGPRESSIIGSSQYNAIASGSSQSNSSFDVFELADFVDYVNQGPNDNGKSELDQYLEESKLEAKFHRSLDILNFWKSYHVKYPCLSRMACDVLSIPITTVASESTFSIGSRVLSKYRCSLLPDNVQAIICARNWLHGFNSESQDEDVNAKGDDDNGSNTTVDVDVHV